MQDKTSGIKDQIEKLKRMDPMWIHPLANLKKNVLKRTFAIRFATCRLMNRCRFQRHLSRGFEPLLRRSAPRTPPTLLQLRGGGLILAVQTISKA